MEKIVISLSPLEVNEISYADLENRMNRLEQFIISKLDNTRSKLYSNLLSLFLYLNR